MWYVTERDLMLPHLDLTLIRALQRQRSGRWQPAPGRFDEAPEQVGRT